MGDFLPLLRQGGAEEDWMAAVPHSGKRTSGVPHSRIPRISEMIISTDRNLDPEPPSQRKFITVLCHLIFF